MIIKGAMQWQLMIRPIFWRDVQLVGKGGGGCAAGESGLFFLLSFYSLEREGGEKTVTAYKSSVVYSKKS